MLLQHLLNGFKLQTRFVTSKNDKLINPESKFCFEKANKGVGKGRIRRQGSKLGAQSPFESLMCSDVLFWVLFLKVNVIPLRPIKTPPLYYF